MGLIARRTQAAPHETWPNMFVAAEERYWDAVTLACSDQGREAGAIYLLGYTAEMLLKTAYCRFNGLSASNDIYAFLRSNRLGLHSLSDLYNQLVLARTASGNPMRASIAGAAQAYVLNIEQHWEVKMRYFDFPASLEEANVVLTSVEGLFAIYQDIWS